MINVTQIFLPLGYVACGILLEHVTQYEPKVSIIDALMWNAPEDIKAYLENDK